MKTAPLLLSSPGADSRRSWEVPPHQIEWRRPPRALRHEEVEWTQQGIERDAVHIPVSLERCPAISGHTSHPSSSASHSKSDKSPRGNTNAAPLVGTQSIET